MSTISERADDIKRLGELIADIEVAMLATVDGGKLRSRPMMTQETEFDGDLWFFTGIDTAKVHEVEQEHHVCLSYASPDDNRYVSVSGTAVLVRDRDRIKELWKPVYKAWFPQGVDDPNIALLRVSVEEAQYWEASSGAMVQLLGFVKALATGKRADVGHNEKIDLTRT